MPERTAQVRFAIVPVCPDSKDRHNGNPIGLGLVKEPVPILGPFFIDRPIWIDPRVPPPAVGEMDADQFGASLVRPFQQGAVILLGLPGDVVG